MTEMPAGTIEVCGYKRARRVKRRFEAMITIEDPATPVGRQVRFHREPKPAHLLLRFEDLDEPHRDIVTATRNDVERAIEFGRANRTASMLIHCYAGIARSTAVALAIIADRLEPGQENGALEQMLTLQPDAVPNLLIIRHADEILQRSGALLGRIVEWDATRAGNRRRRELNRDAVMGEYADLTARRRQDEGTLPEASEETPKGQSAQAN